ncbi:MAG: DUF4143 domain-containing protein [Gammaproteobacteria bacterium]|nr:DUF4143 domain-containing protein [Gammaproteobacteria bacterium]
MYSRRLEPLLIEFLNEFRVIYLTGPRQAGKSTLVRSVAALTGMDYLTLDNQAILAAAQNDPHGFIQSIGDRKVVLDEFQYAPQLILAIKEASDALSPQDKGKFILTGSADIFRSAKTQEALPGHMARLELYPLAQSELHPASNNIIDYLIVGNFQSQKTPLMTREALAGIILQGGYPEVQTKSPRAKQMWFRSYLEGRLWKDFETLYAARGDYHSRLAALVPYLAGLSGNLLKYAHVANDLGLDDKVVRAYTEILDLMFIVKRLPAYLKNKAKRLATTLAKLHMVDTGLACFLLGLHTEDQVLMSHYYGGLLENFLVMECFKQATWSKTCVELYHFRDTRQKEVDLVLEQPNGQIIGIEIKASSSVNSADFNGLVSLAECSGHRFDRGVLFYSGQNILPFKIGERIFYALPIASLSL